MAGEQTVQEQIREIVRERVSGVQAKTAGPLVERQSPDVVTFDVLPPLHSRGSASMAERLQAWFDSYDGPVGYQVQDVNVWAAGDLAFCSFLYRVFGTLVAGGEVDMWVRATLGLERVDGAWSIVHDHESVPFDPATGAAVLNGTP